jgi:ATP-dependent Clp protease ATP-binding subunit ClpA
MAGENGFDPKFGARPMARLIHDKIKQPLAQEVLFGKLSDGGEVTVEAKDGNLQLDF